MNTNYHISIASPPDRKKLVAEIFFGKVQWAEINKEKDFFEVEFYTHPQKSAWVIPFNEAMEALEEGRKRLLEKLSENE